MSRDSCLKRLIWLRGSPAGGSGASYEKTVGPAPIISISDAKAKPAKSLIVGMEPIQDLHGYDSPWPAGGGKNKYDVDKMVNTPGISISNGVITVTGNAINSTKKLSELADLAVGETYILTANTTGTENIIYLYGTGANVSWTFGTSKAITQEMLDALVMFYGGLNTTSQISNFMIRLASVADATYAPYSNLCPISGRTEVTVYRTGVNVWDEEWEFGQINGTTGENVANSHRLRSKNYIPIVGGEPYYFVFDNVYTGGTWVTVHRYGKNKEYLGNSNPNKNTAVTMPNGTYFIRFNTSDGWGKVTYMGGISINYPSTDTDYHAYTGASFPVSWQTEAGTVYGGTVDLVSGNGSVVGQRITADASRLTSVARNNADTGTVYRTDAAVGGINMKLFSDHGILASESLEISTSANAYMPVYSVKLYTGYLYICIPDDDIDAAKTWATSNPVNVVATLKDPIPFTLTPTQIQLLKGSNTLWSDADDLTLTYIGTTPPNLLGGGYNPPAEQDPEELTEPEATETDEPTKETPAEEGENNGE